MDGVSQNDVPPKKIMKMVDFGGDTHGFWT